MKSIIIVTQGFEYKMTSRYLHEMRDPSLVSGRYRRTVERSEIKRALRDPDLKIGCYYNYPVGEKCPKMYMVRRWKQGKTDVVMIGCRVFKYKHAKQILKWAEAAR